MEPAPIHLLIDVVMLLATENVNDLVDGGRSETVDSVKDFLEMVYKEGKSISLLKRQYEDARKDLQFIKGLDYSRPHVTGGETADLSCKLVAIECEQERYIAAISSQLEQYAADRKRAAAIISRVSNPISRAILQCHYLQGMKYEDICGVVSYEQAQVMRLRGQGMRELEMVETLPPPP